jgi:hypothetical protein
MALELERGGGACRKGGRWNFGRGRRERRVESVMRLEGLLLVKAEACTVDRQDLLLVGRSLKLGKSPSQAYERLFSGWATAMLPAISLLAQTG